MKFGTDGVRGVANTELTAEFALALGRAAARVLGRRRDVGRVGRDTRVSAPMLEAALVAGFAAEGVDVDPLGVVPTPAVAFAAADAAARRRDDLGLAQPVRATTASSCSPPAAPSCPTRSRRRIEAELDRRSPVADRRAGAEPASDRRAATIATTSTTSSSTRSRAGASTALRIVVDCANGAASAASRRACSRALGADVDRDPRRRPTARNINDGCGATHPASLAAAVVAHGADLGLALDGDADRLIAVDHTGPVVDGDHIIAICAHRPASRAALLRDDTVVVTVMTNLGFRLAMRARRASTSSRPPSATATCSRRSTPADYVARRRAERPRDLPPTSPRPATACSPASCCSTSCSAPAARSPTSPRRR